MRTILILSLIAASFASAAPVASAECVQTACVIASSYTSGSCSEGYQTNDLGGSNENGLGYVGAGGSTYCYGAPGYFALKGVNGGVSVCDAAWDCTSAGVAWGGGAYYGGQMCVSYAYVWDNGAFTQYALPLCTVAGAPPAVPALLP